MHMKTLTHMYINASNKYAGVIYVLNFKCNLILWLQWEILIRRNSMYEMYVYKKNYVRPFRPEDEVTAKS